MNATLYGSRTFMLRIPHAWGEDAEVYPSGLKYLAQVAHHEIDHCRGERHRDMCQVHEIETHAWEGLRVRKRAVRPKPTAAERTAKRREAAEAKVRQWERKLKLAQTHLRKWRRKARYYERQAEKNVAGRKS